MTGSAPCPRTGRRAARGTRLRRAALVAAACALLSTAAVPAASAPQRSGPAGQAAARAAPLNILLAGLDTRAGLSKKERDRLHVGGEACECTDVMMLLHLSADRRRASLVSIPRDSYVPFAPHRDAKGNSELTGAEGGGKPTTHRGKINAAHAHGGRDLTVRTVERATGLRVDHYLETDFAGFEKTVDRLDGARVCTRKPLRDANSGLDMAPGEHRTDGREALRFVRARHVVPPGDLGRVRRQQQLMAGLLERLTGPAVTDDPAELLRAAQALRGTVRTDDKLTPERVMELARELRGLDGDRTEFATVPIKDFDHRVPTWGSTLLWDEPRAKLLFRTLREDRPLRSEPRLGPPAGMRPVALEPSRIPVEVHGTGAGARRVEKGLRDNGFDVGERAPTGQGHPASGDAAEIRYAPGREREAEVLAAALPEARLRPVREHQDVFTVVLPRSGSGTKVADIVYDRSSIEGAPVSGRDLDCDATGGTEGSDGAGGQDGAKKGGR